MIELAETVKEVSFKTFFFISSIHFSFFHQSSEPIWLFSEVEQHVHRTKSIHHHLYLCAVFE